MFTSVIHFGVPVPITSEISKLNSSGKPGDEGKVNSYFRYLTSRIFIVTLFFTIIIVFFSVNLSDLLVDDSNYYYIIIFLFLAAPFGVMYSIVEAFLRSFNLIDKIVKISVISNILSLLMLIPLIILLKFVGVSLYLFIFGTLPFVLLFFVAKKFTKDLHQDKGYVLSKQDKHLIFKIGFVSLFSSLMHQGIIIMIRKLLIVNYGYEENGIYQSVLSISLSYFGLLYIFLTNYTLPKLSSCNTDESICKELNVNARFLLLIIIPMMIVFYGFKDYGILLLFSKNFLNARDLIFPQFLGDIFRLGAALFGLWLVPKRKIKQIIIIDISFNLIFFALSYATINILSLPLVFVSYSYMIAFIFHFILYFTYTKFTIKFKIDRKVLMTFIYSILAFVTTYFITENVQKYGYILVIFILISWFILVMDRNEIYQMRLYLISVYKDRKNKEL